MSKQFFYVDPSNEKIGPLTWVVLEQLHSGGTINDATLTAAEGALGWTTFADQKRLREQQESLPPVPGSQAPPVTSDKGSQKSQGRSKRSRKEQDAATTRLAVIVGVVLLIGIGATFLLMNKIGMGGSVHHPKKVPFEEIADAIEAMPELHLPNPEVGGLEKGYMLLFTGEDSALVRPIPDHPTLYQIDVTRYGVVYSNTSNAPRTRNALTILLKLGTEFKRGRWELVEAWGSSAHEVSRPGGSPKQTMNEVIPLDEAMWHGKWVVQYLNSEPFDPAIEAQSLDYYTSLENSFVREHMIHEDARARGIELPR